MKELLWDVVLGLTTFTWSLGVITVIDAGVQGNVLWYIVQIVRLYLLLQILLHTGSYSYLIAVSNYR